MAFAGVVSMFSSKFDVALAAASLVISTPAYACRTDAELDLHDVRFADVVLVGRVLNYRIVRDEAFRRRQLSDPNLPDDMRKIYSDPDKLLLSDYARFEVLVDEVLTGSVPSKIVVTWDNSTFGEPKEMESGPFLLALRRPGSVMPPLRGPSATILTNKEPNLLTLLQAPCSSPFLFKTTSEQAQAVRQLIASSRK
ncbi:hypothetical protein OMW55_00070 [Sphingomonas sp. BN140010]|uniref:Uncharacterized protein n=1 Tax=Sphingomonas arvum TaxID=2992113 RepID=A0ABT3JAV3_9SPHN|nr:hypothetical protein [Sphingomonas sp. BN140010]MCW3796205.1 hypothetical protein [Sphingomonas sp. BN140010]